MSQYRIYLSPPDVGQQERALLADAVESNWIAPLGPHVDGFEREMAKYLGVASAVALSSGTAALHLALRVLGIKRSDVVLCSNLTFVASANPIVYEGAIPVFIDAEWETWNLCPKSLERAITELKREGKTPKALIAVNLYGQSARYSAIGPICEKHGIPIIEDAAESLGATYSGKMSGTFGKMGTLSFNGNKIITTSGGGMLVSNDANLTKHARNLSTQARQAVHYYLHTEIGFNYRMSNLLAAIGRGQLSSLPAKVTKRRRIFDRYQNELGNIPGLTFMPETKEGASTRWLSVLLLDEKTKVKRDDVINALAAKGIEARAVWNPMHRQPIFAENTLFSVESAPVSDEVFLRGVCLPSGSSLTEDQQAEVIHEVKKVMK